MVLRVWSGRLGARLRGGQEGPGAGARAAQVRSVADGGVTRQWRRRMAGRAGLSLVLLLGFAWLLSDRITQIDGTALAGAFSGLGWWQWLLALAFTGLSFWAVGRYDAVLHRHFATGYPAHLARRAGICAIAVSQTLGLGLISGAILRWRMLPGVSLWQATRLTAAVALSFLAGWAVVTSTALVALPAAPHRGPAMAVLAIAAGLAALCLYAPRLGGRPVRWPNSFTLARLVGLCAIDTIAAALAFHSLLPDGADLPFSTLLPAFLLALGAGLALGTPGGMGAFELTLLAQLPASQEPQLLAAILAWRIVYYVLPALLGAGLAVAGPARHIAPPRLAPHLTTDCRAEAGLCHQGNLALASVGGQAWLMGGTGHTLIALLDPMGRHGRAARDTCLRGLRRLAKDQGRMPVAYKIGAGLAARARRQGFAVRRVGWEAWLCPLDYRLGSSSRSGLRRKLRRAEAAGVTVTPCPAEAAPWAALDHIAQDWARAHGGERGFSMGRHHRAYLAHQLLYIAWQAERPIAYASFHRAPGEWALDVMRHVDGVPDGTMYSLVQAAIDDAARAGISRLSLAAVPEAAMPGAGARGADGAQPARHAALTLRLLTALAPETAASGLYRFKASFAPRWHALYLAAPGRAGLVLAGLALWRAIARPTPIMPQIDRNHAEYGFASAPASWHIEKDSD